MANPFKPLIDKLPKPLRNKYFLVLVFFVGWLIFVDRHDVLTQFKLRNTLQQLENDKAYYEQKTQEAWQDRYDMEENQEKFAREKYYMKKNDEEVFILKKK